MEVGILLLMIGRVLFEKGLISIDEKEAYDEKVKELNK